MTQLVGAAEKLGSKSILTSRKVVIAQPRDLRWETEDIDIGSLAPDDVVGQTVISVISPGTELAAYAGAPALRPGTPYPRVVGYCNAARVVAVGTAVDRCRSGDLILTFQSHRSAFVCKQNAVIATLPPEADLTRTACAYLYHLGYHALLRGGMTPGLNVGVIGLGALGLTTAALASVAGGQVHAISGRSTGRARAPSMGARFVYDRNDEALPGAIEARTQGTGLDIVATTSNLWEDWLLALRLARRGGAIVVLGFPGRGQEPPGFNPLASEYFYTKQLCISACGIAPDNDLPVWQSRFTIRRNMAYLLDLIACGRLDPSEVVSETIDANAIESAYERLLDRDRDLVTVALDWSR